MTSISVLGAVVAVIGSVGVALGLKAVVSQKDASPISNKEAPYKTEPSEAPLPQGFLSLDIIDKYDRRSLTYTAKKHGILFDKDGWGFYVIHTKQVEQLVELVKDGKITGKKLKATIATLENVIKGVGA